MQIIWGVNLFANNSSENHDLNLLFEALREFVLLAKEKNSFKERERKLSARRIPRLFILINFMEPCDVLFRDKRNASFKKVPPSTESLDYTLINHKPKVVTCRLDTQNHNLKNRRMVSSRGPYIPYNLVH